MKAVCGACVLVAFAWALLTMEGQATRCWSTPVAPYLVMHQCYRDLCRCNNYTLDCSSNRGRLTYVPRVLDNVQVLNFSNNHLLTLPPAFFVNVSHTVRLLDLYNNGLTILDPLAFSHLPRLSALLIGGNVLNYSALAPVLAVPTLRTLDIKCGDLGPPPAHFFVNTSLANSLVIFDLSWNQILSLDMTVLQPLYRLRNLSIWHNGMYKLRTACLPSVQYLNFGNNDLQQFPRTCQPGTTDSLFPNLTDLHLDFNVISEIMDPVCLPSLKVLDLNYNRFVYFQSDMFSGARFPAMYSLEVNQMNKKIRRMESFAFNNSALVNLSLGLNNLDFASSVVDYDVLGGLHNLRLLFLDRNDFHGVTEDRLHRLLRHVPQLDKLYLGYCQLTSITPTTFTLLPRLRELHLYQNVLSSLPDGAFDGLRDLRLLQIDSNHISIVQPTAFNLLTRKRLQSVILSGNPFQCGCDVLWFQSWLTQEPHKFRSYRDQGYMCANLHNTTVQKFYLNEQACILSTIQSILTIMFTSLIIMALAAWSLCFGYRWYWRLCLYEVCRGRDRQRNAGTPPRSCTYDVFVAYAEGLDVEWVLDELLPVLEGRWGLRVCIHQRDFIPGKHIIDNISDCVEDSHKLLMVFSPHFARSEWCQFELKMCQACVMERDDVLVVVTLQETVSRDLTGVMLAVMRTTTYIEWGDCRSARASFFGRLSMALSDVITRRRAV